MPSGRPAVRHPWASARLFVVGMLAALLVTVVGPVGAVAAAVSPAVLKVSGSPFDPGGGRRASVSITLTLSSASRVDLRIVDFNGRLVKRIERGTPLAAGPHDWAWKGRDQRGRTVPVGPYRLKVAARTGTGRVYKRAAWITRARRVPYKVRPGAIVVAIDPGHGGPASGAVSRGLKEDAVNLDISLRLEAMLKGAGIGVVMTRRRDKNVSPAGKDLNGDGRYNRVDELIARNDIANEARADIHLAVHNNASPCHCTRGTEMYTHYRRDWSPEGRKLARFLLDAHIRELKRQPGYRPRNRGVASYPFKALKPYHKRAMPRPSLQPSVLGESLFIDWPSERRILGHRPGRSAIAAAYFDGIANYLAWRAYGLRYEILDAPRQARPGGSVSVRVRLTNRGRATSSSWRLVARVAPKVRRYDGRPRKGQIVARMPVPDGLAPGDSTVVTLSGIDLPRSTGEWLVKLDVRIPGGDYLSRHGVVGPQHKIRTTRH